MHRKTAPPGERRRRAPLATILGVAVSAAALTGAALAGTAHAASSASTGSAAAANPLPDRWYAAAPYLMPEDNDAPDAVSVMNATGLKAFQLAFILDEGNCTPSWDGTSPVSTDTAAGKVIDAIRANGGDVSVSIGGYNGTKLGQSCGTPAATAAAYQQVIDKYDLHAIDFDLEEPEYENATAVNNELGAAQILQKDDPGLYVSVTMPGTAAGTGWFGTQLLDNAKSLGFTPNNFSIMPFDGGFNGSAAQISALEAFHGLLESTFGWDSATAYAHEGVSMMNGRSDSGEYFYQSDFQNVLDYAESKGLARYTFWSVNRDRECTPVDNQRTSGTCSSVAQNPWEFSTNDVKFAGATPPTSAPPTTPPPTTPPPTTPPPTTTPPTTGTGCDAAWNKTTAYTGGQEVSYDGHNWKAKWWTYGDVPGDNAQDVWVDEGACS